MCNIFTWNNTNRCTAILKMQNILFQLIQTYFVPLKMECFCDISVPWCDLKISFITLAFAVVLGKLGPRQLGPVVRGPTICPEKVANWATDSWAPGPSCPGPNCPPPKSGKLGPGQLGPGNVPSQKQINHKKTKHWIKNTNTDVTKYHLCSLKYQINN